MATLADRFWAKVQKADGCWEWQGARNPARYGKLFREGHVIPAHRLAWEFEHGPIPEGLWVLHSCDNPPCVNPAHLFLGTHRENMADMVAKGRSNFGDRNGSRKHPERLVRGSANHQARLSEADVLRIRELGQTMSQYAIAAQFGITQSNVSMIVRRERWAHI